MNSQKGLSTILSIFITLLVAAIAGAGVWAYYQYKIIPEIEKQTTTTTVTPAEEPTTTPTTTDETADWKTYTNTRVGYKFEYPAAGLKLDINETIKYPSTRPGDSKTEDLVQFATATITYSVETQIGMTDNTIEDWIKNTDVSHVTSDFTKYTRNSVDGQLAYTLTGKSITYVMKNSNVYIIKAMKGEAPLESTASNPDPIYKHLLSTFKFTK